MEKELMFHSTFINSVENGECSEVDQWFPNWWVMTHKPKRQWNRQREGSSKTPRIMLLPGTGGEGSDYLYCSSEGFKKPSAWMHPMLVLLTYFSLVHLYCSFCYSEM